MNLIDRYVNEVGKRLLIIKGREDIEKELRSTLEDMLEDRAQKAGHPVDESMQIDLLKEYGSPDKVAAIYNPHPYLIGPGVFPFFLKILRLVIFGITVGLTVVTGIQVVTQTPMMGSELVAIVGRGLGDIISTCFAAFGYLVLTFAVIERLVPDLALKEEEDWDPRDLAKEPDPTAVKRSELIVEIVFTFIGLAILNDRQFYTAIFSEAFIRFIPWINFTMLAKIVLDIYLLRNAVWTPISQVVKIAIQAVSLGITYMIYQTPNIFAASGAFAKVFLPENAEWFNYFFHNMFPLILILAMFVQVLDIAKSIYQLFKANYSGLVRVNSGTK